MLETTVLVVDDEEFIVEIARSTLESRGYTVLTASDGVDAVAVFKENRDAISVVVLDMTMPGMNGESAIGELRRICPGVCVILSSGYGEEYAMGRIEGAAPDGFLQKPYPIETLVSEVRRVIANCNERRPAPVT